MVTKEDCEMMGKDFVPSHEDGKGGYTKAYCRKRRESLIKRDIQPMEIRDDDFDENPVMEFHTDLSNHKDDDEIDMEDAGKHYKLPKSNLTNAKVISKDINTEDKKINHDLRDQDFEDIPNQAVRIEKDAGKESRESHRLFESQRVFAREKYGEIKNTISKREKRDKDKTIKSESKVSRRAIHNEHKRIRHEKKEARRKRKLDKLSKKHGGKGGENE